MASPDWDHAMVLRALLDGQNRRLFSAARERDFLLMEKGHLVDRIRSLEERVLRLCAVEERGPGVCAVVLATLAVVASLAVLWP